MTDDMAASERSGSADIAAGESAPRQTPAADPPTTRPGVSGIWTALALVVGLGAAAGTGFLYWERWRDDGDARLRTLEAALAAGLRDIAAANAGRDEDLGSLRAESTRLAEAQDQQQRALADARAALAESVAAPVVADGRAWKLAEAAYLLRVANHRLLLERDAAGALGLLVSADGILAALDDFSLHEVRALLAGEIASLRAFRGVDAQGVFLRLEALKGLLHRLPLRLPEYVAGAESDAAPAVAEDASAVAMLTQRLGDLVRFRRFDDAPLRPLLAPEQAEYLEQHLRLAVDRAQLALLRGDQEIYRASLAAARDWLGRFMDAERGATREAAAELDALLELNLDVASPDISASLARLRTLLDGHPESVQ